MRKFVLAGAIVFVVFAAAALLMRPKSEAVVASLGMVVPVEHRAMDEMVRGFQEVIEGELGGKVKIDVQNAGGDINIQKAIIARFKRNKVTHVIPIGTDVTLMTMNLIKDKSVIGLDVTNQVTQSQANVTGVQESDIAPSYTFLKTLLSPLNKVAVVYSASDKNVKMVEAFCALAKQDNVEVQPLMIHALSDLYVLANRIDADCDALFIAKDHLVASGASALAAVAEKLNIPLVTSDEGSVLAGGAVACGNKEADIGRAGGKIFLQLLNGKAPNEIPIAPLDVSSVFVNERALSKQGLKFTAVEQAALKLNHAVEKVYIP